MSASKKVWQLLSVSTVLFVGNGSSFCLFYFLLLCLLPLTILSVFYPFVGEVTPAAFLVPEKALDSVLRKLPHPTHSSVLWNVSGLML